MHRHTTHAILIVAHPGHEVRVHGWLASAQPQVCILTDGSGRTGPSRLDAAKAYLTAMGLSPGSIFGRFTDQAVYAALLKHDFTLFLRLTEEFAEMISDGVEWVVGDATEGYNSTHDVCRLLINAAIEMAKSSSDHQIKNFDFPVVSRPDTCPPSLRANAVWLHLDDTLFEHKLQAARAYYPELVAEVDAALHGRGNSPLRSYLEINEQVDAMTERTALDIFRVECLRPVHNGAAVEQTMPEQPFYEIHSEKQVAAGYYQRVIRYHEHIRPLAHALWKHVQRSR